MCSGSAGSAGGLLSERLDRLSDGWNERLPDGALPALTGVAVSARVGPFWPSKHSPSSSSPP
jgi:hypothetical protein